VIEIPTTAFLKEYINHLSTGWYKLVSFGVLGESILSRADRIVTIGSFPKVLKKFENKIIEINNGINVDEVPMPKSDVNERLLRSGNRPLQLVSVANTTYWHGYDRIITGLHNYYKNSPTKPVYYHCVGNGSDIDKLRKLSSNLSLDNYVIFHGAKVGTELNRILERSDIAFGSLGFHRSKLKEGSPLKTREYCARGIPFVIAYDDPDFPELFPYVLKIPSDESPVDIDKVCKWYEELTVDYTTYPIEMRKYAEEHLTWDAKLRPVIEKITEIIRQEGKNDR